MGKKIMTVMLALAMMFTLLLPQTAQAEEAENLLVNGGMEEHVPEGDFWPVGWGKLEGAFCWRAGDFKHSGRGNFGMRYRFDDTPNSNAVGTKNGAYQDVVVEPNTDYRLGAYFAYWNLSTLENQPIILGIADPNAEDPFALIYSVSANNDVLDIYYGPETVLEFNSGDLTKVRVIFYCVTAEGVGNDGYQSDDFSLVKVGGAEEDPTDAPTEAPEVDPPVDDTPETGDINGSMFSTTITLVCSVMVLGTAMVVRKKRESNLN